MAAHINEESSAVRKTFASPSLYVVLLLMCALLALPGCSLPGFKSRSSTPEQEPAQRQGTYIAMLLPNTGSLGAISTKIMRGANLAAADLRKKGQNVTVTLIGTSGNWQQKIAQLPPEYTIIGGPLQKSVYEKAKNAGLTEQRMFFAFLGKLDSGDEGRTAWRFFASAEDQVDAVAGLAGDLGLRSVGSFYPASDSFGVRMTNLLEQKLADKGIAMHRASYSPSDPAGWSMSAKALSGGQIEAVFLPDSWKKFPGLHSAFVKNGDEALVEMGTMLWANNLDHQSLPNAGSYPLVAYPSNFVRTMAPAPLSNGGYDGWHALGYDFVRFAARLHVKQRPSGSQANSLIRQAALMNFASAPISYDNAGIAHQKLFMMQPGTQGGILLNKSTFQSTRSSVKASVEERLHPQPAVNPDENAESGEGGVSAEPGTAQAATLPERSASSAGSSSQSAPAQQAAPEEKTAPQPVIPTRPQTSYKLSVPVKK